MTQDAKSRAHLVERAAGLISRHPPESLLGQGQSQGHSQGHGPGQGPGPGQGHGQGAEWERPRPPPVSSVTALLAVPPDTPIPLVALTAAGLLPSEPSRRPGRAQEEIAVVQHQILRGVDGADQRRIILVASALPREGRSFIALNLAAGIATAGARPVLLVDADGSGAGMSSKMGIEGRRGLRDLVAEPRQRGAEMILPTALERLFVLPLGMGGNTGATPGGTLADAVLRLAAALPHYVILLDAPPCLSASEASALSAVAGQVVLVVNAQRTARNEVEAALDLLESCPVLQLLLNRVRLHGSDRFGAHHDEGRSHAH